MLQANRPLRRCLFGAALALLPMLPAPLLHAGDAAVPVGAGELELVMFERDGCSYCRRWNEEIGPAYPRTAEGRFAPLRRVQLNDIPEDLDLETRPVFTPTFILVEDGRELGRIEGYAGDEFFWFILDTLLDEHGVES